MPLTRKEVETYLASVQPFAALPAFDLLEVAACARACQFAKGEAVYNEGEAADSVWLLHKGRIQVFKYTSEGKPLAIESLAPGELFGTLCRLGGGGRTYPCTAVASEPTTALRILDKVFLKFYAQNPGFIRGVCSLCSERLKEVQDLRCEGREMVPVRMAATLLRLTQVHGTVVPFTKRELSELIGATLVTTFRVLADLQKKGIVSSSRGKIHIKRPDALRALADKR